MPATRASVRIIRYRIVLTQLRRIFSNLVKKQEDLDASDLQVTSRTSVRWLLLRHCQQTRPHPSGTETTESTEVTSQTAGLQRPTSMASIITTEDTRTLHHVE